MSDNDTAAVPAALEDAAQQLTAGLNSEQQQGDPAPAATEEKPEDNLADPGKRALMGERAARKEAERKLSEVQAETERVKGEVPSLVAAELRKHLVALHEIPAEDAALFVTGNDPDTVLKQVSRLVQRTTTPTTPKPDPTQGAQNAPALNGDELTDALARAVGAR